MQIILEKNKKHKAHQTRETTGWSTTKKHQAQCQWKDREWNSSFCQQTNRSKIKNYFLDEKKSSHNLKSMVHSLLPDSILLFQKNHIKLGITIFLKLDCFPSNRGNIIERTKSYKIEILICLVLQPCFLQFQLLFFSLSYIIYPFIITSPCLTPH